MEHIVVQSKIQYEDFRNLILFSVLKMGKRLKTWIIASISAMILLMVALGAYFSSIGMGDFILPNAILFALVPFLFYFLLNATTKSAFGKSANVISVEQRFTFSPDNIHIEALGESVNGTVDYAYDVIYKAFEVKGAFYLYNGRKNANVIGKRYMDEKTMADLRALLSVKLADRFVRCF